MNEFLAIFSAVLASALVVALMHLLVFLDMRMQIKSYNKRHKDQFDINTNPFTMSKRYKDWYVEKFANMKEGFKNENEK